MKLLVVFILLAFTAFGDSIEFCSDGVNEGNDRTGANVAIAENPAWVPGDGACRWVSYAATGGHGEIVSPPNTDLGTPTAVFWESFFLPGPAFGTLRIWADDTAGVKLESSGSLIPLASPNTIQDGACAAGGIACEPHEGGVIEFYVPFAGVHTMHIPTYQRGNGPFGAYYRAIFEVQNIPEPGTLSMLAIGIALLGVASLKKRRK